MERPFRTGVVVVAVALAALCTPAEGSGSVLGTTWALAGKARMSAGKYGSSSVSGPALAVFGADGSFTLRDAADAEVYGHLVGAPGPRLEFDPDFDGFIRSNLGWAARYIRSLTFSDAWCVVEVTTTPGLDTMKLTAAFSAVMVIYDPSTGSNTTVKLKYAAALSGARSPALAVPAPALAWRLSGKTAFSCGRLRDAHPTATLKLVNHGANREFFTLYEVIGGVDSLMCSGICVGTKTGLTLWPWSGSADDAIAGYVDRLVAAAGVVDPQWDWDSFYVWLDASPASKVTVRDGVASLSGKLVVAGSVPSSDWSSDREMDLKVTWSFSGSGSEW